jgi:hypothetical protein
MNELLSSYPDVLPFWEWLVVQPVFVQVAVGMIVFLALWLGLFIFKNVLIALLRQFGLSTPTLYGHFPTLPWRSVMRVKMRLGAWIDHVFTISKHSSGGFSSVVSTLTNTFDKGKIPLGLPWAWGVKTYQTVGLEIKTHLMLVAQSGAGKSVWIKTAAAQWQNSLFAIDPKNELNRDVLAHKSSHQVVVLRPYGDGSTGQLNPFDCLREAFERGGESQAIRWAYRIGKSFIETPVGSKNPFFTDTTRGYLVGLILFVESHFPPSQKHLGTVRQLIVHGLPRPQQDSTDDNVDDEMSHDTHGYLHELMIMTDVFSGAIAGAAAPFITSGKEVYGNLQATLQERTKVLDIPSVAYMFKDTTRPIRELKTHRDYSLTLDCSVTSIKEELQDAVRLIINMIVYTFEAEPTKNGQCLMILDEFNACGYNSCIESSMPVLRSQGLSAVPAIQDLEGLQAAYPKTYLSFIGNSDATVWMSSSHPKNLGQLSSILGKKTLVEKDSFTGRKSYREVDVATPEQLGRFLSTETHHMIVTRAGKRALRLFLDPHYKALPVWQYSPDPDHKEALFRRLVRRLIGAFFNNKSD